jgi:AcrR family transcriptional regulator
VTETKPKPSTSSASKPARVRANAGAWTQDPEGVRRNILDAARKEFVEKGLSGARVDEIAARIATSKRMIYYYFKDKQGLYIAVLEEAYSKIRATERALDLAALPPAQALNALAAFTFDHHADNTDFVRLVMIENIHHARHLKISTKIGQVNLSAIGTVRDIYERGVVAGLFRPGIDPFDIHLTMSALSFYNVSNQATIHAVFGHDMAAADARKIRRAHTVEAIMRLVGL